MNKKELLSFLHIKQGDITKENVDVIVNAANPSLLGGGGVDGAIHGAAGSGLLEECRKIGPCQYGEAKITKGYNLKAKHVIHTPGPVYVGGAHKESEILKNSYCNSMLLAKENNLKSIAFPAISTGVYHYPKEEACNIAINTVLYFILNEDYEINTTFVLFDDENYSLYINYIEKLKFGENYECL